MNTMRETFLAQVRANHAINETKKHETRYPNLQKAVRTNCNLRNWLLVLTVLGSMDTLSGCAQVKPLSEYQHLSHATQHFGADKTNYGYDIASLGVRWRPRDGVTVDLLEGYCAQSMQGRREVFTGRITVEFGNHVAY